MSTDYKSRKLWLVISCLIAACVFLTVDKLDGSEWVTVVIFILGMYKTANVAEKRNE